MASVMCKPGEIHVSYTRSNGTKVDYCRKDTGKAGKTPKSKRKIKITKKGDLGAIVFPELTPKERKGKFMTVAPKKCFEAGVRERKELFGEKIQAKEQEVFKHVKKSMQAKFVAIVNLNKNQNPKLSENMLKCGQAFLAGFDPRKDYVPSSKSYPQWSLSKSYITRLRNNMK